MSAKGGLTYGVIEAGVAGFTAPRLVDVTSIAGGILGRAGLQVMTATSERACAPLWPIARSQPATGWQNRRWHEPGWRGRRAMSKLTQ